MKGRAGSTYASERGAALLAALCFMTILALALGSYAGLCYFSLKASNRSLQSSRSLEIAESGLEDALWALNHNSLPSDWPDTGWTLNAGTATKTIRTVTSYENSAPGQMAITIANYSADSPTITTWGQTVSPEGSTTIIRALQCMAQRTPLFVNAVGATTGAVTFAGAGTADSYNSLTGDYDPLTAGFSAIIASGATRADPHDALPDSVKLNTAQINGYVVSTSGASPPDTTLATIKGPSTPADVPVDPAQIRTTNTSYQAVYPEKADGAAPTVPPLPPILGTPGSAAPTVVQVYNDLIMSGTDAVTVDGPVTLWVPHDFSISDNAKITVSSTGSLSLHIGHNMNVDGLGIENLGRKPSAVAIFNSSASNTQEFGSSTPFYGTIYTPNSALTVNGNPQIYGAIVAQSITFSGSPQIHYDMALRTPGSGPRDAAFTGITAPYAVTKWNEISPAPTPPGVP